MLEASAWLERAIDRVPFFNEAGAEANGASVASSGASGGGASGGASAAGAPAGAPAVAPASVLAQRRRTALLASAVLPFEGRPAAHGKKKALPAAQVALQEGLKTTLKDAEQSAAAVAAAPRLRELACRLGSGSASASRVGSCGGVSNGVPVSGGGGDKALRLEVGLLLTSLKALWRPALAVALAVELQATLGPCPPRPPPDGADARDSWPAEAAAVAAQFEFVAATVARLGLDGCWATKPLLNGKELGTLLNLSPGPQIGDAMRHQALWQLEHPTGTKAGCLAALQARAST